jgi:DNA-binding IclR family transcriptional regulator
VIAALSIPSPSQRLSHPVLLCSVEDVQAAMGKISQELGHPLESLREGGEA